LWSFSSILLEHIIYKRGFNCDGSICVYHILQPNPCPLSLPLIFHPWNKISRFHCPIFIHVYRILWPFFYFDHIQLPYPLRFALSSSTCTHPQTYPILHSCNSLLMTRFHMWAGTWFDFLWLFCFTAWSQVPSVLQMHLQVFLQMAKFH
jgi:hypothetical protein